MSGEQQCQLNEIKLLCVQMLSGLQYNGGAISYQLPGGVTLNSDGSLHPQAQILLAALAAQVGILASTAIEALLSCKLSCGNHHGFQGRISRILCCSFMVFMTT